uniref:Uncharacterized protein n=1 Tax=Chromera velia CCMP2878 TaxID=1169474 RepID=A0A0G4FZG0_9ALVE|eukprot:Cvel_19525.t1-p1 / transcript=Cvel_19525.t1 / gene=Cvel_19525 / organism=Chromera_velia_CCMP2878 / gene_product=hypothetical protein / transcript_product=hypothetical protein / location=Cvel_scaffold1690:18035-18295(-) / protein_length=87 / sequence_SO=supercontig / SO=protein_coding / is_pseudo=false
MPGSPVVEGGRDTTMGTEEENAEDVKGGCVEEPLEPSKHRLRQNTEQWGEEEGKYVAGVVNAAEMDRTEATLTVKDRSTTEEHGILS